MKIAFGCHVAASTFVVADRECLAKTLDYCTEEALNAQPNWHIKVGTDGLKTMF